MDRLHDPVQRRATPRPKRRIAVRPAKFQLHLAAYPVGFIVRAEAGLPAVLDGEESMRGVKFMRAQSPVIL